MICMQQESTICVRFPTRLIGTLTKLTIVPCWPFCITSCSPLCIMFTIVHHVHHCASCSPLCIMFTIVHHVHHCVSCSPLCIMFTIVHHVHHCASCSPLCIMFTIAYYILLTLVYNTCICYTCISHIFIHVPLCV